MGRIVCSRAEQLGAGLVVLPEPGHKSWLQGLLGGSVGGYVRQHCARPVQFVARVGLEDEGGGGGGGGGAAEAGGSGSGPSL